MHLNLFGWNAAASGDVVTDPGLWTLDNFGNTLLASIFNGVTFSWNSNASNATNTRATVITGAPTASRSMIVSST